MLEKVIGIRIDQELFNKLEKLAKELGFSISHCAQLCLQVALNEQSLTKKVKDQS